jgi:hypothetical protein
MRHQICLPTTYGSLVLSTMPSVRMQGWLGSVKIGNKGVQHQSNPNARFDRTARV